MDTSYTPSTDWKEVVAPDEAQRFAGYARQFAELQEYLQVVDEVVVDIGASNVDVQRIEFRESDGWKVRLTANSFTELELLRERGRQQGLPVRLDSASKEGDRVQATLTLEQGA